MSNTITRECKHCSEEFEAEVREVNRGNGKYCSLSCCAKDTAKRKEPNTECAYCGKPIKRQPSEIENAVSGKFFCCREHKDKGQRLESGIKEIQPDHYGNSQKVYRSKALREHADYSFHEREKLPCTYCEENLPIPVLEVHHKDGNRKNNKLSNLVVLCPTCHQLKHFKEQTGKWG